MRQVAIVAWREIFEDRSFVVAAIAALLVTLVVPLIPGLFAWSPGEVRGPLTGVVAIGFTVLGALFLGSSTVSGTVATGRFGFFLARPLSGAAIWFGKLIGVITVLLVCELIVLLPNALLDVGTGFLDDLAQHSWMWSGILLGGPLVFVLLAHAVNTVWRAPTAWIGFDLLALLVAGTTGWMAVNTLLAARAELAAAVVLLAMTGAVVLVILGAGAVQISAGRCDPRRHHQVFSRTMWPALLVLVAGIAGYGWWLRTPGVGDLKWADGGPIVNPSGEWIGLTGLTRGRWDVVSSFTLNLVSRKDVRIGIGSWGSGTTMAFSGDGRRVAWFLPEGDQWRLHSAAMDSLQGGGGDTAVFMDHQPWMVLSDRGDRAAMIEDGTLVVMSLPAGDVVGSVRLAADRSHFGPYFASDDRVGVFTVVPTSDVDGPPSIRALEFDLEGRKMVELGFLTAAGELFSATIDGSRHRLLLGTAFERRSRWRYVDSRTFAEIPWTAELDLGPVVTMLEDGRLVRLVNESGSSRLEVLSPVGVLVKMVPLPRKPKRLTIGFQPGPSTLVVAISEDGPGANWFDDWVARLVDLESGEIRDIGVGIVPASWWFRRGDVTRPLPVGCAVSRLFVGGGSSLWLWDQQTGELEQLVSGRR